MNLSTTHQASKFEAFNTHKALLFQAITSNDASLFTKMEQILQKYYGPISQKGEIFRFDEISRYYQDEMGDELYKCFYIFEKPVSLEHFYRYKIESQSIEKLFFRENKRSVNIDPGSLTLYQLSLLTTKAFSHRTYLAEGIYAECTLLADGKNYKALQWTYPDYQSPEALEFFADAKRYLKTL
ncbi:MAG: DUF4416 family protein [Candidatus Neomarinimicrobiota bacterium]